MAYQYLFEPIQIGRMLVPNRIFHAATDNGAGHINGEVSRRDTYHYGQIAKGGLGLANGRFCGWRDWPSRCMNTAPRRSCNCSIPAGRRPGRAIPFIRPAM